MKNYLKILNDNRGMALMITIMVISLILVITLRFNTTMRSSLASASNLQDTIALDYMAKSIINAARGVLSLDAEESGFDSLQEDWANMAAVSQYFSYFFNRGQGGITIIDHSGRLQVNSLIILKEEGWVINEEQRNVWLNLLSAEEFGLGEDGANAIVEALIDWIDEDDEPLGFGGAESSYYKGLETPYTPRNGPMEFIEELLLVRGITPELYYGTEEYSGLATLVTPYGSDGRININTADRYILWALSEQLDEGMVEAMLDYRENEDNDLSNPQWYQLIPGFPSDIVIPPNLLTISSSYFEVSTEVVRERMRKKVRSMIARGPGTSTQLIYWKIE